MRPIRLLILLAFFVAFPIILTCLSIWTEFKTSPRSIGVDFRTRSSRFNALFSFAAPSTFFPPSAVISLTNDNSTFFLARPAAFGPDLPSHGLSGQLWVGKGFGEERLRKEEDIRIKGFELGCSDVPGWTEEHGKKPENTAQDVKTPPLPSSEQIPAPEVPPKQKMPKRSDRVVEEGEDSGQNIDGTDDHLHYPLPDSNPAAPAKSGEPAVAGTQDKSRPPTHADIESLQESADIAGKIVLLSRGGCGFLEKVKWAQRRGGIALVVGDNEPGGQLTIMYAKGDTSNVTIPALFTSYNAAHLLSSLVPQEKSDDVATNQGSPASNGARNTKDVSQAKAPVKSASSNTKVTPHRSSVAHSHARKGFMQDVLSAMGLADVSPHAEDSRRPPSSGNIDWVLLEDFDDDKPEATSTPPVAQVQAATRLTTTISRQIKAQPTTTKKTGNDDFVIGVQDWRDTEVIAPKPSTTPSLDKNGKPAQTTSQQSSSVATSRSPTETALKGGIITPGSGEYDRESLLSGIGGKQKEQGGETPNTDGHRTEESHETRGKLSSFFGFGHAPDEQLAGSPEKGYEQQSQAQQKEQLQKGKPDDKSKDQEGLWVTLTPTSVSASPFFDTLLVLVVSPLVTLTFVYGLLLLRSRIRRRRWRAPKSIVERLPVRTYHTMSAASSTTSAQTSPDRSHDAPAQLRPTSHRPRPRSQTTAGVVSSTTATEKEIRTSGTTKKYAGRQVECVVCLEEYVDGESKVMSLPCGHEFHAECITPWLVTRRRTCPICKGDVVRSMARSGIGAASSSTDQQNEDEATSDDVQERVVTTVNQSEAAANPIPTRIPGLLDDDLEQGDHVNTPLLGGNRRSETPGGWRSFFGSSLQRVTGDTAGRSLPHDRAR